MLLVASCLFGMEKFVADDIDALGYKRVETMDGRVIFEAPVDAIARCNIFFRYAERVLVLIGSFDAYTFNDLFEGVKALPWERYVGKDDAFPVKGHSIKSKLFSIPDCQKIIKKAVVERLKQTYSVGYFDESGAKVQIEFLILKDKAMLMVDTTGVGLHKRGYRPVSNAAPLRETLAAALVNMSRPRESVIHVDPFCGSGTIPIEAALLATNRAPGLGRGFVGEALGFVPRKAWSLAREEARSVIKPWNTDIFGFDIDPSCVEIAKENAKRAGVLDMVNFACKDVRSFVSPIDNARGTIVCNPPYGERMGEKEDAQKLYAEMGKTFAKSVPDWQIYVICNDAMFERHYGRRADKVRKLYNGMIPCLFYQFFKKHH